MLFLAECGCDFWAENGPAIGLAIISIGFAFATGFLALTLRFKGKK